MLQGRANSVSLLDLLLYTLLPKLLFTKRIQFIPNRLPGGNPVPLTIKPNAFVQDPVHLWMATGSNEHIASPRLAILGDICKINGLLTLFPHLPHLCSVKEPGIQTSRWLL